MNASQEQDLIRNYGTTDASPVLAKYRRASDEFDRVVKEQLYNLKARIQYELRKDRAEKILNKIKI